MMEMRGLRRRRHTTQKNSSIYTRIFILKYSITDPKEKKAKICVHKKIYKPKIYIYY